MAETCLYDHYDDYTFSSLSLLFCFFAGHPTLRNIDLLFTLNCPCHRLPCHRIKICRKTARFQSVHGRGEGGTGAKSGYHVTNSGSDMRKSRLVYVVCVFITQFSFRTPVVLTVQWLIQTGLPLAVPLKTRSASADGLRLANDITSSWLIIGHST